MNRILARRIFITGVVQGVGFRPFLFQLAARYGLAGRVVNTARGVTLDVEGPFAPPLDVDRFCAEIHENSPPLASIAGVQVEKTGVKGYETFTIASSRKEGKHKAALIAPDVSVCEECVAEMNDPGNRRFGYPFINCTNCGPRYTIIKDLPYDRPRTSMAAFTMCQKCRAEYDNPMDRRFHAQPNACPECGPHAFLVNGRKETMDLEGKDAVTRAADLLGRGEILGVKGLGGFHLAVDAFDEQAVARLRTRKSRPDKPFAVMAASVAAAKKAAFINEEEQALLQSHHRPIVLVEKKEPFAAIAPNNRYIGIMLAYTPLHRLLLDKGPDLLVMTSGNLAGEPLCIDNDHALDALAPIADSFLLHNREICFRADDSIVQHSRGKTRFLRRSRGYAPLPVLLSRPFPGILALGGGLKSTVCLTKENRAFPSQYIGDLDNRKVFDFYRTTIAHLKKILDIDPGIVACDMHPGYMSTGFAETYAGQNRVEIVPVQHHHAHAVSCMAENHLENQVIAVTLDGTGFGTDGTIWGGEVLVCSETCFTRKARLAPLPMPGGEAAVKEPWRMAAACLFTALGPGFVHLDLPFIRRMGKEKLDFMVQMMEKRINSPFTSSCGRLFDAVASLADIRDTISFEGQAAMELEAAARFSRDALFPAGQERTISGQPDPSSIQPAAAEAYDFDLKQTTTDHGEALTEIDWAPAVGRLVDDIRAGVSAQEISRRFHSTIIAMFAAAAAGVKEETGIETAVLSGGVFNNAYILEGTGKALEQRGIRVYTHSQVPCGDGGISLGQAVVAGATARKGKKQ
ncbi:MAG: carbamoyltransferase HypF [Desulfobacteraceae bacterium]